VFCGKPVGRLGLKNREVGSRRGFNVEISPAELCRDGCQLDAQIRLRFNPAGRSWPRWIVNHSARAKDFQIVRKPRLAVVNYPDDGVAGTGLPVIFNT